MLVHLNEGEFITVTKNGLIGDLTKHAITISNKGGLFINECNGPAEQGESPATDRQQLQAKIRLVLERIKIAALEQDMSTIFQIVNETYAELSAMQ